MDNDKSGILNGAPALTAPRTIGALGPIHGYGSARRIERASQGLLELNEGTLYPMLPQLHRAGWIGSKGNVSDTGRRARRISLIVERFAASGGSIW
jgi:hypothetical protein